MKISVIVVCKNEKATIAKTIDSVLAQTYKNYEIIVLDGNSTDGTLWILEDYKDKIRLVTGKENGIYGAMNDGIEISSGEIIYFLNANDSLFSNDIFEKVIGKFQEEKCDLIYGDTNFQSTDECQKTANTIVSHKDFYSKFVWVYRNINHQSTFYKKSLFEKYGKYNGDEFSILADVEFTTNVITQKDVKHLYLPLIIANYNSQGVSSYKNPRNVEIARKEKRAIAKKYLNFEYNLFEIYNFFFNNRLTGCFNEFLKKTFGLNVIFKIRDFKRVLGRTFVWWMVKI